MCAHAHESDLRNFGSFFGSCTRDRKAGRASRPAEQATLGVRWESPAFCCLVDIGCTDSGVVTSDRIWLMQRSDVNILEQRNCCLTARGPWSMFRADRLKAAQPTAKWALLLLAWR